MNYEPFLWFGVFLCVLVGSVYFKGRKMSAPEKMIRPAVLEPQQQAQIAGYGEWLNSVQLEHRTTFQFGSILVVVFQQKDQPRYFSFMFHKRLTWCAESYLKDLTVLDTTNSGSFDLVPRPGAYRQNFPGISVSDTWRRHLEGEAHLSQKFGYQWSTINRPSEELLADAMRVRMSYNRSQSFWPLRVLYRNFVTGRRDINQSIMHQFPIL